MLVLSSMCKHLQYMSDWIRVKKDTESMDLLVLIICGKDYIPPLEGNIHLVYKRYILPIGWWYTSYHLLHETEKSIGRINSSKAFAFLWPCNPVAMQKTHRTAFVPYMSGHQQGVLSGWLRVSNDHMLLITFCPKKSGSNAATFFGAFSHFFPVL